MTTNNQIVFSHIVYIHPIMSYGGIRFKEIFRWRRVNSSWDEVFLQYLDLWNNSITYQDLTEILHRAFNYFYWPLHIVCNFIKCGLEKNPLNKVENTQMLGNYILIQKQNSVDSLVCERIIYDTFIKLINVDRNTFTPQYRNNLEYIIILCKKVYSDVFGLDLTLIQKRIEVRENMFKDILKNYEYLLKTEKEKIEQEEDSSRLAIMNYFKLINIMKDEEKVIEFLSSINVESFIRGLKIEVSLRHSNK
jgi:hypothetical protein